MTRSKAKKRKPHPTPIGPMYDAQIVRDFIERSGGFRAASRLASLNQMTIRSAANGGNITMATFQRLAYVIGVTGCQLLGGPCASKS